MMQQQLQDRVPNAPGGDRPGLPGLPLLLLLLHQQ
jgi:hypothetical protein